MYACVRGVCAVLGGQVSTDGLAQFTASPRPVIIWNTRDLLTFKYA